jgi:hypothetical protein
VRWRVKPGVVLTGSGLIIVALTAVFGFLVPLANLSFSPFTVLAGSLISVGLFAAARFLSKRAANFLVAFLAVQCVLKAIFDLKNLTTLSIGGYEGTDAWNMYQLTGVPAVFWALFWVAIAFIVLCLTLRAYAVARERPSQPDLPFEDSPLEV